MTINGHHQNDIYPATLERIHATTLAHSVTCGFAASIFGSICAMAVSRKMLAYRTHSKDLEFMLVSICASHSCCCVVREHNNNQVSALACGSCAGSSPSLVFCNVSILELCNCTSAVVIAIVGKFVRQLHLNTSQTWFAHVCSNLKSIARV